MTTFGNVGSIAAYAYNRIDGVPSTISGTPMQQYAEQAVYQLENYTSNSIGTTAIDTKYAPFLIEMTTAMTLSRMHGIGVDFNWSLGEFSITRGQASSTELLQTDLALKNAQRELESLGKQINVYMTYYG